MRVSLERAVIALTSALDFVGIDEVHHGKRVALMAYSLAREMGWDAPRCRDILYAGMLHDCGVSRHHEHRNLTATLEWEGAEAHCLRGENYLLACPPLAHFAPVVRWHHTRWESLVASGVPAEVAIAANLVYLADRTDVLLAPYITAQGLENRILWEFPELLKQLAALSGVLFCPDLILALHRAAAREAFWLRMDPAYIVEEVEEHLRFDGSEELDTEEALAVAGLFARTVDAKSSYTLEHSTRVAAIARFLAGQCDLAGEHLVQVEIAALLHDVGKLRVCEEIIDKPGPITVEERAFIRRHSFDSGRILARIFPGEPIAEWASMHHENLLGTGYPDHLLAASIPLEARLIAVADIFQALSQHRPYRGRLDSAGVIAQLDELSALGRIDAGMVELVRRHLGECYRLAVA